MPAAIRDLRQLTRHRQQLVNQRRAIKTRILAMLREARVLRSRKVGREVWYWPDPCAVRAALDAVGGYLQTHFRSESEPPMRATSARPSAARRSRR